MSYDAGGAPVTAPATIDQPSINPWDTAWAIVWRAAEQCGGITVDCSGPLPWQPFCLNNIGINGGSGSQDWFMYAGATNCSQRLAVEQNLVCVADKLAQLSDAVGTTVWPAISGSGDAGAFTYNPQADAAVPTFQEQFVEWDIPPQADADRFILRDLAVHVLGLIPTVDAMTDIVFPGKIPNPQTCAQAFEWAIQHQTLLSCKTNTEWSEALFGAGVDALSADGGTGNAYPVLPPSAAPLCDAKQQSTNVRVIAESALVLEGQIMRSAGRLLHDTIRRNVYSDLAASAQAGAQGAQTLSPTQASWGVNLQSGTEPYGTIAHAARVLLGRWELGQRASNGGSALPESLLDPQCEGVTELALVTGALPGSTTPTPNAPFGPDLDARFDDLPISTPGQQTAVQLVEQTGLIVPPCQIPGGSGGQANSGAGGSTTALRSALATVLQAQAKSQSAVLYQGIVGNLADADVVFAFQRVIRTWRLLTNQPDPACTNPTYNVAGLTVSALNPGIPGGAVINGGLVRTRLQTDTMARAAGMLEASQCVDGYVDQSGASTFVAATVNGTTVTSGWTAWGTDDGASFKLPVTGADAGAPSTAATLPSVVFQDAFHVGQALERRLALLDQLATSTGDGGYGTNPLSGADPVARGGIAELRTWAGSTMVQAWATSANTMQVVVEGLLPTDLGLSATAASSALASAAQAAYGFVYGPPWAAECAAGVRQDCPTNFAAQNVVTATSVSDLSTTAAPISLATLQSYGVLNSAYALAVTLPSDAPPIPATRAASASSSHLYMVLLHDPTSPTGIGRVLGTLPLSGAEQTVRVSSAKPPRGAHCIFTNQGEICTISEFVSSIVNFIDAPMQRELVHDALDIGKWVGSAPPSLGDESIAQPSGYCVDGIPRDLFVPLDNELISGSQTYEDSWQYYLSLAQNAASAADALGQQLIANDLQISENQQTAGVAFAGLCGDFAVVGGSTISPAGVVSPASEDSNSQSCISPPTTDVVYFGGVPSFTCMINGAQSSDATKCFQQDVLKCGGSGSSNSLCSKTSLSFDSFGLFGRGGNATVSGTGQTPHCDNLTASLGTLPYGLNGQKYYDAVSSAFSPGQLAAIASSLQMHVDLADEWDVTFDGIEMMSSTNPLLWPACLGASGGCTSSTISPPVQAAAAYLNAAFRWCPNLTAESLLLSAPLGCDGPYNQPGSSASSPGSNAVAAELNMLKWRVTQGLWQLAAMVGEVPNGMFYIPVPAAAMPAGGPSTIQVPYIAVIDGQWVTAPSPAQSKTMGNPPVTLFPWAIENTSGIWTNAYVESTGTVYDVAPAFTFFTDHAAQEIPAWYLQVYTNGVSSLSVKHTSAEWGNGRTKFDSCIVQDLLGNTDSATCLGQEQKNGLSSASFSASDVLGAVGGNVNNVSCNMPWGSLASGVLETQYEVPLWSILAGAKGAIAGNWVDANCGGFQNCVNPGTTWWSFETQIGVAMGPNAWNISVPVIEMNAVRSEGGFLATLAQQSPPFPLDPSSPSDRVLGFLGAMPENGDCSAISLLAQPTALACATLGVGAAVPPSPPLPVQTVADLAGLSAWVGSQNQLFKQLLGVLYVTSVPNAVVTAVKTNSIGAGGAGGAAGSNMLQFEQAIQGVATGWNQIVGGVASMQSSIDGARLAIQAANAQEQVQDQSIAFSAASVQGQMLQTVFNNLSQIAMVSTNTLNQATSFGAASAPIAFLLGGIVAEEVTGADQLSILDQQQAASAVVKDVQVQQALNALTGGAITTWTQIQTSADNVLSSVATVNGAANQISLTEGQAAYQLAVATGADFVTVAGQEIPLPVDTVLRRQASATEQRYQIALTNAKALAYMARRAIEQRIGVPLNALTQSIGPLDPPASWADSICSLQGVNYASLSTAVPTTGADGGVIPGGGIDGSVNAQAVSQYADAFVGDYVTKLTNFVTYYNTAYPSHQGDDTAVLSLRYDLLMPASACQAPGANLLLYSGQMDSSQVGGGTTGWQLGSCGSASACVGVYNGGVLAAPTVGPDGEGAVAVGPRLAASGGSGVSWLFEQTVSVPDGGVDAGAQPPTTSNTVYQTVTLEPGSYVLSWWDQARDSAGDLLPPGSNTSSYVVQVIAANNQVLGSTTPSPFVPAMGDSGVAGLWSTRNTLSFTAASLGSYTIAFGAPTLPTTVAIADVQLELSASGLPSAYVATAATTSVSAYNCPMSDADFRAAFTHSCDTNGNCWYDLGSPLVIDTGSLNAGTSSLDAKLAAGNYNYRNIDVALNLVGTSVHTCVNDPNPNCYGSGYIQYDLNHDATRAGIVGYDGNQRFFDFGIANINHGKALAAERYLTMPLAMADQQLVTQPGIQHIELGGRPLDGTYSLRIWDSPDLNWSALTDIQMVFDYEYWSNIVANGNTKEGHRPPHLVPRSHPKPIVRVGNSRRSR